MEVQLLLKVDFPLSRLVLYLGSANLLSRVYMLRQGQAAAVGAPLNLAPAVDTFTNGSEAMHMLGLSGRHQLVNASLAVSLAGLPTRVQLFGVDLMPFCVGVSKADYSKRPCQTVRACIHGRQGGRWSVCAVVECFA